MILIKIKGKVISKDNEKVFNKAGRPFLSKRFKDYQKDVAYQAMQQISRPVEGDIEVRAMFFMKNRKHSDLANIPKGIFDSFNKIVWLDDRQIKVCHLEVYYDKYGEEGANIYIDTLEKEGK